MISPVAHTNKFSLVTSLSPTRWRTNAAPLNGKHNQLVAAVDNWKQAHEELKRHEEQDRADANIHERIKSDLLAASHACADAAKAALDELALASVDSRTRRNLQERFNEICDVMDVAKNVLQPSQTLPPPRLVATSSAPPPVRQPVQLPTMSVAPPQMNAQAQGFVAKPMSHLIGLDNPGYSPTQPAPYSSSPQRDMSSRHAERRSDSRYAPPPTAPYSMPQSMDWSAQYATGSSSNQYVSSSNQFASSSSGPYPRVPQAEPSPSYSAGPSRTSRVTTPGRQSGRQQPQTMWPSPVDPQYQAAYQDHAYDPTTSANPTPASIPSDPTPILKQESEPTQIPNMMGTQVVRRGTIHYHAQSYREVIDLTQDSSIAIERMIIAETRSTRAQEYNRELEKVFPIRDPANPELVHPKYASSINPAVCGSRVKIDKVTISKSQIDQLWSQTNLREVVPEREQLSYKEKLKTNLETACLDDLRATSRGHVPPSAADTKVIRLESRHCLPHEASALTGQYGVVLSARGQDNQPLVKDGRVLGIFGGARLVTAQDHEAYERSLGDLADKSAAYEAVQGRVHWAPYGAGNRAQYANSAFKNMGDESIVDTTQTNTAFIEIEITLTDRDGQKQKEKMYACGLLRSLGPDEQVRLDYGPEYRLKHAPPETVVPPQQSLGATTANRSLRSSRNFRPPSGVGSSTIGAAHHGVPGQQGVARSSDRSEEGSRVNKKAKRHYGPG